MTQPTHLRRPPIGNVDPRDVYPQPATEQPAHDEAAFDAALYGDPADMNEQLREEAARAAATPWVPPRKRKSRAPAVRLSGSFSADLQREWPSWSSALDSPAVLAAYERADSAAEKADQLAADVSHKGETPQRLRAYQDAAREAREELRHGLAVVGSEARRLVLELPARIAEARQTARAALEEAEAATGDAVALVDAVHAIDHGLGIQPPRWHQSPTPRLHREALAGLQAALDWVHSDDPVVGTAAYITEPTEGRAATFPAHTLAALRRSSSMAAQQVSSWIESPELYGDAEAAEVRHMLAERDVPKA